MLAIAADGNRAYLSVFRWEGADRNIWVVAVNAASGDVDWEYEWADDGNGEAWSIAAGGGRVAACGMTFWKGANEGDYSVLSLPVGGPGKGGVWSYAWDLLRRHDLQ